MQIFNWPSPFPWTEHGADLGTEGMVTGRGKPSWERSHRALWLSDHASIHTPGFITELAGEYVLTPV